MGSGGGGGGGGNWMGPAEGTPEITFFGFWAEAWEDTRLRVVAAKSTANAASLRRFIGTSPLESGVRARKGDYRCITVSYCISSGCCACEKSAITCW